MKTPTLTALRKAAAKCNLIIDTQQTGPGQGWSYWLLNPDGTGPLPVDNYHSTLDSVADAICVAEAASPAPHLTAARITT